MLLPLSDEGGHPAGDRRGEHVFVIGVDSGRTSRRVELDIDEDFSPRVLKQGAASPDQLIEKSRGIPHLHRLALTVDLRHSVRINEIVISHAPSMPRPPGAVALPGVHCRMGLVLRGRGGSTTRLWLLDADMRPARLGMPFSPAPCTALQVGGGSARSPDPAEPPLRRLFRGPGAITVIPLATR